jgi:hypothetical protein
LKYGFLGPIVGARETTMSVTLGNASRARELAKLFEAWRRAFEVQDHVAMQRARRAIDSVMAGKPRCNAEAWASISSDVR